MSSLYEQLKALPSGRRSYALQTLPSHLANAEQFNRLRYLLTNFDFLQTKLNALGPQPLISDFDLTPQRNLCLIQSALRMSAHILEIDPRILASHLVGRLLSHKDYSEIGSVLEYARANAPTSSLVPLEACLDQAGSSLQRSLMGHTGWIHAITFSPNMQFAVSASGDSTLRIWDINNGDCLHVLQGHIGGVTSVVFSPNGTQVASGGDDGLIKVWNTITGDAEVTLEAHISSVMAIAWGANEDSILSGSEDGAVKLWDLKLRQCVCNFQGHMSSVIAVAISPDGKLAVSGAWDNTIRIWDVTHKTCVHTITLNELILIVFRTDAQTALVTTNSGTVQVWDLLTPSEICALEQGLNSAISTVAFSSDGQYALYGMDDGNFKYWDLRSCSFLGSFRHSDWITAICFDPTQDVLLLGANDGPLKLYGFSQAISERFSESHAAQHKGWVRAIGSETTGRLVLTGSDDGSLKLWNIVKRKVIRDLSQSRGVNCVALSRDGKYALAGTEDGAITGWDLQTGEKIYTLQGHTKAVTAVEFSTEGKFVISGSEDRTIRLWNPMTHRQLRILEGHTGYVSSLSVALAPESRLIASSSFDNTIRLWDIAGKSAALRVLQGHDDLVTSVSFDREARRLVSASHDYSLILWDVKSGKQNKRFLGHSDWIWSAAFFHDDQMIISASRDRTLKVWDIDTGECISTFYGDAPFYCVISLPYQNTVVAGDEAGRVVFLQWKV